MTASATLARSATVACLECDLLVDMPELEPGEKGQCPRCRSSIASMPHDGLRRALAYALAAAVLLVIANLYPFLSFGASGLEKTMTLPQSAGELYDQGNELLAALVLSFIVVAPGLLTLGLIALLTPLVAGLRIHGLRYLGRAVFVLGPWSMVEVFLIGVLVSFIKIAALAKVVLGLSFWAFIGFVVCLTAALASYSPFSVWNAIERSEP